MMDFRGCVDALNDKKFQFTTSCTYKTYKKFFSLVYEVCGAFSAEVSFNEDYPPEDCGYNTTVDFEVDENGNYVFVLLNVLSSWQNVEKSGEHKRRKRDVVAPFQENCRKIGNMREWNRIESLK
ncbi:MAG: hypothetical protein JSU72_04085 [Deltaproteobacteria bacterium]|nr:MAG: hypothetical protein JSU72_04085 [Deltaproteobacteria bacterium]